MEIRAFQNRDVPTAIRSAIVGMHFSWYLENRLLLNLYGRYFWYAAACRATQVIAAYEGETLVGLLLAEMRGERPRMRRRWKEAYVELSEWVQQRFFPQTGSYEAANQELLQAYRRTCDPDGEILFLAANPEARVPGVGTALLEELAARERGRRVYLFTDEACTYQFYEHRGFRQAGERRISEEILGRQVSLRCLLYERVL